MDNQNLNWRKARYSNGSGNCVEVADASRAVLVRDTTNRDGGTLAFSAGAWRQLVADVRSGKVA
jgi:hypothetical protein